MASVAENIGFRGRDPEIEIARHAKFMMDRNNIAFEDVKNALHSYAGNMKADQVSGNLVVRYGNLRMVFRRSDKNKLLLITIMSYDDAFGV